MKRLLPANGRERFGVAVVLVAATAGILLVRPAEDPRLAEIQHLCIQLAHEKADLDQMQRDLAAYDAFNHAAADQIHLLQSNPQP
jgi:hypothetical protein